MEEDKKHVSDVFEQLQAHGKEALPERVRSTDEEENKKREILVEFEIFLQTQAGKGYPPQMVCSALESRIRGVDHRKLFQQTDFSDPKHLESLFMTYINTEFISECVEQALNQYYPMLLRGKAVRPPYLEAFIGSMRSLTEEAKETPFFEALNKLLRFAVVGAPPDCSVNAYTKYGGYYYTPIQLLFLVNASSPGGQVWYGQRVHRMLQAFVQTGLACTCTPVLDEKFNPEYGLASMITNCSEKVDAPACLYALCETPGSCHNVQTKPPGLGCAVLINNSAIHATPWLSYALVMSDLNLTTVHNRVVSSRAVSYCSNVMSGIVGQSYHHRLADTLRHVFKIHPGNRQVDLMPLLDKAFKWRKVPVRPYQDDDEKKE